MALRPGPVRTCVGCRGRAAKATLLRVVAVGGVLVCDPTGRLPGRGASVHPDPQCVSLADKRRAFPRALRLAGPLDVTPVREHVAGLQPSDSTSDTTDTGDTSGTSGTSTPTAPPPAAGRATAGPPARPAT